MELPPESVTFQMAKELQALEPFGAGNPCPVFVTRNLRSLSEPVVLKGQHLKLRLAGPQSRPVEAIWFNCIEPGKETPVVDGSIELAYTLELNGWNDEYRLQLNVVDLRVT
jgi:single-stranded-DNA-specific exonuclease